MIASDDGSQLALVEQSRVLLVSLPGLRPCAQIGIDGGRAHNDIAYAGEHLVVLTRYGQRATVHVIDPRGRPRKVRELVWRGAARILAATAHHVLIATEDSTLLITLDPVELVVLPVRGRVTAACRLGNDRFIIATARAVEEWDAVTRTRTRKVELERRCDPQLVGGNALRFWMIQRSDPDQIDVVTLARNAHRRFTLVEPVRSLSVHARGDLAVAIGAETGMPFVIDLAQPDPVTRLGLPSVEEVTWIGRGRTLVFAPVGGAVALHRVPSSTESEATSGHGLRHSA